MASLVDGITKLATRSQGQTEEAHKDSAHGNPEPKVQSTPLQESHEAYGNYQSKIFEGGLFGRKPNLSSQANHWPAAAKAVLPVESWGYLEGGGGTGGTMTANRRAFDKWKLIPRMLTGNNIRSLKTTLFGSEYSSPIIMAPVGVNKIFHEDAELAVAKACAAVGVPYTISTAASNSIEDIATAGGSNAPRFYQLYWPRHQDNDVTLSLLSRAWTAGCRVLLVTVDTWSMGWRPQDVDNAYIPFFKGTGCQIGFSDPVWRSKYATESKGKSIEDDLTSAALAWLRVAFSGTSRTWEDLSFLRDHWHGALLVKGIQNTRDATRAIHAGCDGIVVSNHGGRQYDGAAGSLSVLPEIADALSTMKTVKGEQATVLFDSGIRCGADVLKALALGANAVLVGRPVIYGLAAGGKEGAEHVLRSMLADVDLNLSVLGYESTRELGREDLRFEAWA